MTKIKRKWDLLSDNFRKNTINNIIMYFKNERNENIWIIAAEEILDFFMKEISETIYNKWINDATKVVNESFKDLQVNLDVLKFTRDKSTYL